MHKTPVKNKYEPYKHPSKQPVSNSKAKTSKVNRPCHIISDLIKETPKIKQNFMNNSQNKFLESTNKKKTRATSANGKELQKKDHYFEEKIKQVKKHIKETKQFSQYPTPILTPVGTHNPQQKMGFQYLSKESSHNVERLKAHLQESTNKINHMKRKSDQIILDEVRESQNNLIKQIVDYQKQNSCSLDEGNQKLSMVIKQNEKLKAGYYKQINDLRSELKIERDGRKIAQDKLAQCQSQLQLLQCKMKAKQSQKRTNVSSTNGNKNQLRLQKQIENYEQQMYRLKLLNKNLELKVKECEEEKKFIKKNAVQVLSFLRNEFDIQGRFELTQKQYTVSKKK